MKKKTRDLKKHYRNVERDFEEYEIDISEKSWYNLWHTHLDWDGITTYSKKQRARHLKYYMMLLDKIERDTQEIKRSFQTWIFINENDGGMDAIYLHTENPYTAFPYYLDKMEMNTELPDFIKTTIDLNKYNIGRITSDDGHLYFVQKKGLGISISNIES